MLEAVVNSAVIVCNDFCFQIKCAQYWPNEAGETWRLPVYKATIIIEPISSQEETKDFILRVFQISKESSKVLFRNDVIIYSQWNRLPTTVDRLAMRHP